jgi:uncharacterized protein (TIGR02145 family)
MQNTRNNPNIHNNPFRYGLKNSLSGFTLGYSTGDLILYRCKSGIYTTLLTDSPESSKNYEVEFAACIDADGKSYSIVNIGSQTWMAENLAYLSFVSPPSGGSESFALHYVYGYYGSSVDVASNTANYKTYGVLYNWAAALTACPSGWHLPSSEEWTDLGVLPGAGGPLKESGTAHWISPNSGATNASGFTALPGGFREQRGFYICLGNLAAFWSSSTAVPDKYAWSCSVSNDSDWISYGGNQTDRGLSVRCIKDNGTITNHPPVAVCNISPQRGTTSTNFQFDASGSYDDVTTSYDLEVRWDWDGDGTWDTFYEDKKTSSYQYANPGSYTVKLAVKDAGGLVSILSKTVIVSDNIFTDSTFTDNRDGHLYKKAVIGTQTWMAENLAFLPEVSPASAESRTEKHYYVYGYNATDTIDAKNMTNFSTFGVLYNWPAAMNGASGSTTNPSRVQGVCPDGWHLPSHAEWFVLTDYLGSDAGKSMKAKSGWNVYNGDNSSGFTALPGGCRNSVHGFYGVPDFAYFWSSTQWGPEDAMSRWLVTGNYAVYWIGDDRSSGFSVRCLLD